MNNEGSCYKNMFKIDFIDRGCGQHPLQQSLLCCNCIRHLTISKIAYSHTIQIHSSNAVIVWFIATVFASKQMYLLVTVSLFSMSTQRTALTRITTVNLYYRRLILFCFVNYFLFEVIKQPWHWNIAAFPTHLLSGRANTRQVFQDKERMLRVGFNECLWYLMVYILHSTVFSLTDGFEPSSYRRGLSLLRFLAELFVFGTLLLNSFPAYKTRLVSLLLKIFRPKHLKISTSQLRILRWERCLSLSISPIFKI